MRHDLAVIGAGPAGMAAAAAAAGAGLRVVLLDAAPRAGGQYHRRFPGTRAAPGVPRIPPGVDHRAGHRVWAVRRLPGPPEAAEGFALHALAGEREPAGHEVRARRLVIATGAYDRTLPFPGWDLPGVLTAGGAQALVKGNRTVPGRRVVVAGTGPFLLAVAGQLARAGARVAAVLEANRLAGYAGHPAALLRNAGRSVEALRYLAVLARYRIPYLEGYGVLAAHGADELTGVTVGRLDPQWQLLAGSERAIGCDTLAVGYGFVPLVDLAVQLGCPVRLDPAGSPAVVVDAAQRTPVAGVYAAGETTGVGGARLAAVEGELAGLAAALGLGRAVPVRRVRRALARRSRLAAFAAALHAAHPVPDGWLDRLRPDTPMCRCEEVAYERVRAAVRELGATDPRGVKLFSRTGMGWCQGRICGYAVGRATAVLTRREPAAADLAAFAHRALGWPVPLGTLAAAAAGAAGSGPGTDPDEVRGGPRR